MLSFSIAKINIGLHVIGKRPDGYHNLETVFYPISITEPIELIEARENRLTVHGLQIAGRVENNLVWHAAIMMQQRYGLPSFDMHLLKMTPTGAGLGAGSANGSEVLLMLNKHYELNIPEPDLLSMALELGSDCPIFIKKTPHFAESRGEILSPISLPIQNKYLLLVKPPFGLNTQKAFSALKLKRHETPLAEILKSDLHTWKEHVQNDFEEGVFTAYPELHEIKKRLYQEGAIYASMSGTGATMYGIFEQMIELDFPNCWQRWTQLS